MKAVLRNCFDTGRRAGQAVPPFPVGESPPVEGQVVDPLYGMVY